MTQNRPVSPEIRDAYIAQVHAPEFGGTLPPPWVGRFWNDDNMPKNDGKLPSNKENITAGVLVQYVRSMPFRETIEEAAAFRPEARPLLEQWYAIWNASFPGFESSSDFDLNRNETSMVDWSDRYLSRAIDAGIKKMRPLKNGEQPDDQHHAFMLSDEAHFFQEVDRLLAFAKDDPRDYRLHIIDDADTIVSCIGMPSHSVIIRHDTGTFILDGQTENGLPRFQRARMGKWVQERLDDHPQYWHWPTFIPYMKRRSIIAHDLTAGGAILADMHWQGETHAFIKSPASKAGTWTINLKDIRTIKDGVDRLSAMLPKNVGVIIQEQLPFTHEQRFYVHQGKVLCSAASDRNFSRVDARPNKRLDDRLAVIRVPSIDDGAFDRGKTTNVVDRKTSAAFARTARKIARDMRRVGVFDYVIDLGLTERGVTAVEINTLHYAGPYCMDHRWQAKSFAKLRAKKCEELRALAISIVDKRIEDQHIRKLAYDRLGGDVAAEIFGEYIISHNAAANVDTFVADQVSKVLIEVMLEVIADNAQEIAA